MSYVHVVFTLPHELSWLALQNKKVVYDLLFHASAATLLEIAADPTLADGILDRIVHNAHRIEMRGDSMRKPRSKPER